MLRAILVCSICLMLTTITTTQLWAHSIDEIEPFHVETGDLVTVKVSDFFFGGDATVLVIFFHMEAGSRVVDATAPHESLVPDQSASVRVPASLAPGQYQVAIQINGIENDPPFPSLWVVDRSFRMLIKPDDYLPDDLDQSSSDFKDTDFGDVDNDGDLDIFSANSTGSPGTPGNKDHLFINQGGAQMGTLGQYLDGTSQFEQIASGVPLQERTYDADLVDIDGDGDVDIIRIDAADEDQYLRILINDGTGTFADQTLAMVPSSEDIIAVAGGGLGEAHEGEEHEHSGLNFDEVDAGDVDGDGDLDLMIFNWSGGGSSVLLINRLNTEGRFIIANKVCDPTAPADVFCALRDNPNHGGAFGFFNDDDRLDIILLSEGATQGDRLLINLGDTDGDGIPNFEDQTTTRILTPSLEGQAVDLIVADIDGDGDDDIYIVTQDSDTANRLLWNNGTGQFTALEGARLPASTAGSYDVTLADIDFDGDIDVIEASRSGSAGNRILVNRGGADANMKFELIDPWSQESGGVAVDYTPTYNLSVDSGDYDLDGDIDLVTAGFNEVRIFENDLFDNPFEDMDVVFVLDRTNSMIRVPGDPQCPSPGDPGCHDYLTPTKRTLNTFLAQRRPEDISGLVTFEYTGAFPDNSTAPDDENKAQVLANLGQLSNSALQPIVDGINEGTCSGHCTSIGQGLRKGLEVIHPHTNPEREKVIVLLTDGQQNQTPHPDEVIPSFPSNVRLFTIALGSDTDDRMLSALATNRGRFYVEGRGTNFASIHRGLHRINQELESFSTDKQVLLPLSDSLLAVRQPILRSDSLLSAVPLAQSREIQFEELPLATRYGPSFGNLCGSVIFTEKGIPVSIHDFVFTAAGMTCNFAEVDASFPQFSAGQGQVMRTNNVNLEFDFAELGFTVERLSFDFVDLGGFENISVNGHTLHVGELRSAPTTIAPGITFAVTTTQIQGGIEGQAVLTGQLESLRVGGQEFWLDNIRAQGAAHIPPGDRHFFYVDPSDRQVRFSLGWRHSSQTARLDLIDPKGRRYPLRPDDRLTIVRKGSVFHVYEIKAPLSGVWIAIANVPEDAGSYTINAIASSDLRLKFESERQLSYVGQQVVWIAHLEDGDRLISNANVYAVIQNPDLSTVTINGESIGKGYYRVVLPNAVQEGTYTVSVVATGPATRPFIRTSSNSLFIPTFNPNDIDLEQASIIAEDDELTADGVSTTVVRLFLTNHRGEPMPGQGVSFTTSRGQIIGTILDKGDGSYEQRLQSSTAIGLARVAPIVNLRRLRQEAEVRFIPGPPDSGNSIVNTITSYGTECADKPEPVEIVVVPYDANGNRIGPNLDVMIEQVSGPVALSWTGPVTDPLANGWYRQAFRVPSKPGKYTFSVHAEGVRLNTRPEVEVVAIDSPLGQQMGCSLLFEPPEEQRTHDLRGLFFGFHVGEAFPLANLDDTQDPDASMRGSLEYGLSKSFSILGMVGYNSFDTKTDLAVAPLPQNQHIIHVIGAARIYRSLNAGRKVFFQSGAGVYFPRTGLTEFGLSVGGGFRLPVNKLLAFEISSSYHAYDLNRVKSFWTVDLGIKIKLR